MISFFFLLFFFLQCTPRCFFFCFAIFFLIRKMKFFSLFCLLPIVLQVAAQDPGTEIADLSNLTCNKFINTVFTASSWLAFSKSSGKGQMVTYVNATWTVPAPPQEDGGQIAIWYGIEPDPALNLIQVRKSSLV